MIQNFSSPKVLCRFVLPADKELFVKHFKDDFELILCESDQEAKTYLDDPNFIIHAFVLDQNNLSSNLPSQCKLTNPDSLIIMLHHGIELDSIVGLLDKGKVDKCIAKPYDSNLLRSDIFTAYMGISNQAKALPKKQENDVKPAVLVVDDELIATKFLKKQLDKMACPCEVLIADNAEQALDIFEHHKDRIAIIISDQRMPGMQGNQLLTEIKKHQPAIIRMLTSAYEEVDIALNAVNEGRIFRYIKKPWNALEFNEMIISALSEFQSRMNVLDHQQTDLKKQYDDIVFERRDNLNRSLSKIVDGFAGAGTLAYFLDCLDSIHTIEPNFAALKASQNTEIESDLVLGFSHMMIKRIHVFSAFDPKNASQELLAFIQDLEKIVLLNQPEFRLDTERLMNNKLDLQIIDCLKTLLLSSGLKLSSLNFNTKNKGIFVETKSDMGIANYKHLLSPQTHITNQMLELQCELLALIMLCQKQKNSLQIFGEELEFGLSMQLPFWVGRR